MSSATPGPLSPTRLTRESILDAYIRLADREGPEAVSLRRMGAELGVDATAVYRHFRDKQELLEAVADRLLSDLADRIPPRRGWREDLRLLALDARAMYLSHPRLAHVIATSPEPSVGNRRLTEAVLRSLREAGLPSREAALTYEVFTSYVAGASSLDADIPADASDAWRRTMAALDPVAFPETVAAAPYIFIEDDGFAYGIELFLDAVEARARRPMPRSPGRAR